MGKPLEQRKCKPVTPETPTLDFFEMTEHLKLVPGWALVSGALERAFAFEDYGATMEFVNAVAAIAESQGHHPEMRVGYGSVTVRYTTHDAGGVTENDFICAARVSRVVG